MSPTMIRRSALRQPVRRGAALAEFAVVFPVLVLLLFGIIEVARAVMVDQIATNGVREVNRYSVQSNKTAAEIRAYAETYLASTGVKASALSTFTLECDSTPDANEPTWTTANNLSDLTTGTSVRLTIGIDYASVSWMPKGIYQLANLTEIRAVSIMKKE